MHAVLSGGVDLAGLPTQFDDDDGDDDDDDVHDHDHDTCGTDPTHIVTSNIAVGGE